MSTRYGERWCRNRKTDAALFLEAVELGAQVAPENLKEAALPTAVFLGRWILPKKGFHLARVQNQIHDLSLAVSLKRLVLVSSDSISSTSTEGVAMRWEDRIDNYVRETRFPKCLFIGADGRVVGTWIMGNDYRVKSEYYGGYPAGYLRRIKSLFPDKRRVLHLFSGKVDLASFPGDTVDINSDFDPTYVDDAQSLKRVPLEEYDLVLADPPYSIEDAERYQTTMVKRNVVMRALQRLRLGAHVVWLDQVLPMYRKDAFAEEAVIGMVKSTNHRFRVITIFKRRSAVISPKVAAAKRRREANGRAQIEAAD